MPLILNSLIQAVINSAILFIIYGYLYFQENRDYLHIWTLGCFLQFFRFLFEIWLLYNNSSILSFSVYTLNLLSAYMMVHGTFTFINKKTPRGFGYLVVLNLLWFPVAYFIEAPFYLEVLPIFLLTGIIYLGTGIAFIKTIGTTGIAKYITGVTFILWGIHKANYPFLKPIPEAAYWGFFVTSVLETIAALGILLVHFERAKQVEQISKEELRQQHERFKVTFESIGDGVITTDVKGLVSYMNAVAQELTGYSESEVVGKHISQIFHIINEYTGEPAEIPIEKVIREGIVKGLANHTALIRKDGTMVSIADSAAPIRNGVGEIVGLVMVFRDITKQREVEKSREQLAFIVESSHEAIFSLDLEYRIKSWNQGAEKIYEYKAEEVLGKSAYILAPSERHHELDEYISRALHEKSPIHYETLRLRKDGSKAELMISISPIFDNYDNILGISVIAHDISDRIRSQEMLKRYKMLSDSTTDIILFVGYPDGRIIEANPAAVKAFGYEAGEFLNLTIHDLRDESGIEDIGIQMEKALNGIRFETIYRRKDGSTFPVEVNSVGGILQGQQVLLSICRDITERKLFEEQLKYLSRHDHLTGLYNRMMFDEKLIQLEKDPPYPFAVVICDIDGLKMINDTFGHEAGDRFIKAAANNIKKAVRKQDFLARTAGDEFAIIMPYADRNIAEKTIKKIRKTTKRCKEHRLPIPLYVSIGYAMVDDENTNIKEAQKTAENNMYREKLAVKLAQMMNMNQRQIDDIKLLAMFHDIGKVGVPDNILFKKGPLTYNERLKMQRHTEIGHRIAVSSPELAHISDWILLHHEWWDGNGYPLGIEGEEIPLECRILAVVDAYDAMTKDRPYRSAMRHEEAIAELKRCAGTQFDPSLVEQFLKVLEEEAETA